MCFKHFFMRFCSEKSMEFCIVYQVEQRAWFLTPYLSIFIRGMNEALHVCSTTWTQSSQLFGFYLQVFRLCHHNEWTAWSWWEISVRFLSKRTQQRTASCFATEPGVSTFRSLTRLLLTQRSPPRLFFLKQINNSATPCMLDDVISFQIPEVL